jgi:hypothetical protein
MADQNAPVTAHLRAAAEHLAAVHRERERQHERIAGHLRRLRELHPHQPEPSNSSQEAS